MSKEAASVGGLLSRELAVESPLTCSKSGVISANEKCRGHAKHFAHTPYFDVARAMCEVYRIAFIVVRFMNTSLTFLTTDSWDILGSITPCNPRLALVTSYEHTPPAAARVCAFCICHKYDNAVWDPIRRGHRAAETSI